MDGPLNDEENHAPPDDYKNGNDELIGSAAMRPVFLGNLIPGYSQEQVVEIFERPWQPKPDVTYDPIPVDRIDQKRGYCFVFLKDARSQYDKDQAERFVSDINGMDVTNVSKALRAEFARGDGRVKRKEDERRKNIEPSDTLFVVNFHEETTRREDLEMLFNPFGELVRIDMKRNYAFVQFKTIEQATKAKETTNGGKLDQSVLTVEYVAQQRNDRDRPGRGGGGGGGRRHMDGDYNRGGRRSSSDRRHYDDRRGNSDSRGSGRRSPPLPSSSSHWRRSHSRSRSPPPGGRYAGSSGYRSRSPPRRYGRYDDYRDRRPTNSSPPPYRGSRSPERDRDFYRGERGYRG